MTSQTHNYKKKPNQKSNNNSSILTEEKLKEADFVKNVVRNRSSCLTKTDLSQSLSHINKRYGLNYENLPKIVKGTAQFFKKSDFYY